MSTTNPPPGGLPGAGPQWPADAKHGAAPDDHGGGGGVDPAAIRAGHEPDAFAVKPILGIPLAVVVSFVIAFSVAAGAFAYFAKQANKPVPFANPTAVARSAEGTNQRLERVEREGLRPNEHAVVDQPRLEPLKRLEKDGMFFARPEMPTGNSPEIHWEELRPDRVAGLHEARYVDKDKKVARIPIGEAMKLAAADKTLLPVQKNGSKAVGTNVRPSASNGGVGVQPSLPKVDTKETPAGAPKTPEPAPAPKAPEPPKK